MIRMSKKTKKSQQDIQKRLDQYFGKNGLGLDAVKHIPFCAYFEGGGGFVAVDISEDKDSSYHVVEIQSREWEYDTRRFLNRI